AGRRCGVPRRRWSLPPPDALPTIWRQRCTRRWCDLRSSLRAPAKARVQEAHQRRDTAKDLQYLRVEAWRGSEVGLEFTAAEKLLVAQIISCRVIGQISPRHPGQL